MDFTPLIIIATIITFILLAWLYFKEGSYTAVEEPNPEYIEEIGKGRQLFINEILEHLRLVFTLSDDEIAHCSCELVREHTNRLTIASQDQIFTILCEWNKRVIVSCYRNKNVDGVKLIHVKKSFKLKDNMIDWKKFDAFLCKALDKFLEMQENSEDFKTLIQSAAEVAKEVDDKDAVLLLCTVAEHFPWTGKKMPPRLATKSYVALIGYLLKYHQQEFLEYLKEKEDLE